MVLEEHLIRAKWSARSQRGAVPANGHDVALPLEDPVDSQALLLCQVAAAPPCQLDVLLLRQAPAMAGEGFLRPFDGALNLCTGTATAGAAAAAAVSGNAAAPAVQMTTAFVPASGVISSDLQDSHELAAQTFAAGAQVTHDAPVKSLVLRQNLG